MAIRNREELMSSVRAVIGENDSDDALALLDDITDTMNDLETRANNTPNGTNWEQKYRENDAAWRKKYRDRFFGTGSDEDDDEDEPEPHKNYSFESLFKEG